MVFVRMMIVIIIITELVMTMMKMGPFNFIAL